MYGLNAKKLRVCPPTYTPQPLIDNGLHPLIKGVKNRVCKVVSKLIKSMCCASNLPQGT